MSTAFEARFQAAEELRRAGRFVEAAAAFQALGDAIVPRRSPKVWVLVVNREALCALQAGNWAAARGVWERLARAEFVPDADRAKALGHAAAVALDHGGPEEARAALTAALAAAEAAELPSVRAQQHGNLGLLELRRGDLAEARAHLLRAAEIFTDLSDQGGAANAWSALGEVALRSGQGEAAEGYFREALALLQGTGDARAASVPRASLANLLRRSGRSREALERYEEVARDLGTTPDGAGARLDLARCWMDLGDWPRARALLDEAHALAASTEVRARIRLAEAAHQASAGALHMARALSDEAAHAFDEAGAMRGVAAALIFRARLSWTLGMEPERLPEQVGSLEMPEVQVAIEALAAERAFAARDFARARALSEPAMPVLAAGGERVRALKAESFVATLDYLERRMDAAGYLRTTLRSAQDLIAGGCISDGVGLLWTPALALLVHGQGDAARRLHELAAHHEEPCWAPSWHRSLARLRAIRALLEGQPAPSLPEEPPEGLEDAALEAAIKTLVAGRRAEAQSQAARLHGAGRLLMASWIAELCALVRP